MIINKVLAAPVDLGNVKGVGMYQYDMINVGQNETKGIFGSFISNIITVLTVVGGLAFVVYFFIGAIKWIIAGGDKGKITESKDQMTQGAIGLITIVVSYFVVGLVGAVLGLDILNPFKMLGF